MITEDYVSFETAKLLKKKGFPQEYDIYRSMVYNEEDYEDEYEVQRMVLQTQLVKAGTLSSYPVGVPEPKCYCPTLQMAMKWLREVHKLHIEPHIQTHENYNGNIYNLDGELLLGFSSESPEQACEVAIKYCLEHLI